jgi:hypothetical protein
VDLGTADELALDALINALTTFSKEQLGIKQLVLGGENDDWAAPQVRRLRRRAVGCVRKHVGMPPFAALFDALGDLEDSSKIICQ